MLAIREIQRGKGATAKGGGRNKEARGSARGGAGKTRKGRR